MTRTAGRDLYKYVVELNEVFKRVSGNKALTAMESASDSADILRNLSSLFSETREEVIRADFPSDDRTRELIERLNDQERQVINNLVNRAASSSSGAIASEVTIERLLGIAEQLENAGVASPSPSREDMIRETESLISEVHEWKLEEYAKKTLLIQLNSISRVIQSSDLYSSSDLRHQVKSIIGDFAAEFAKMDKEHQTKLERLVMWGRRGFFMGTTLLGLTSDASAVAGLLSYNP